MTARTLSYELVERMEQIGWEMRQLKARIDMDERPDALMTQAIEVSTELELQAQRARQLVASLEEYEGVERAPVRVAAPVPAWMVSDASDVLAAFDAARRA